MQHPQIVASLKNALAIHKAELDRLSHTLLGQGYIVADAYVRTVQDAARFGGKAGVYALGPSRSNLTGTYHLDLPGAEAVAAHFQVEGQDVKAIHVVDWHRRAVASLESTIADMEAQQPTLLAVDQPLVVLP